MNNRRALILLAAAIVVAIAVLMIENPDRSRVDDVGDRYFLKNFESSNVDRIEVTQLIEGAEIKRDGERWLVRKITTPLKGDLLEKEGRNETPGRWFRADRSRVSGALGNFGGLAEGVVVSSNEDKRRLYRVEATGVRVKLFDRNGELIDDIIVGKNGPDLASSYVRRSNEDEVYLLDRSISGVFTPFVQDWRDRKLWILKPEEIVAISIDSKDGSFSARKDRDGKWIDASGGIEPDQEGMNDIATKLLRVNAEGFPSDPDMDTGDGYLTLTIERDDGKKLELVVFRKDGEGNYPAKLTGVDEIYMLSDDFVEGLPRRAPAKKTG